MFEMKCIVCGETFLCTRNFTRICKGSYTCVCLNCFLRNPSTDKRTLLEFRINECYGLSEEEILTAYILSKLGRE